MTGIEALLVGQRLVATSGFRRIYLSDNSSVLHLLT
jgi:hypothetical protein